MEISREQLHNLRTAAGAIRGAVEVLAMDCGPKGKVWCDMVERNANLIINALSTDSLLLSPES